jgi:hypothetical protein
MSTSVPYGDINVKTANNQLRLVSNNYAYRLLFDQYESQEVVFLESAAVLHVLESEKSRAAVLKSKLQISYSPSARKQFIQATLSLQTALHVRRCPSFS